jgi:hypothetical protein
MKMALANSEATAKRLPDLDQAFEALQVITAAGPEPAGPDLAAESAARRQAEAARDKYLKAVNAADALTCQVRKLIEGVCPACHRPTADEAQLVKCRLELAAATQLADDTLALADKASESLRLIVAGNEARRGNVATWAGHQRLRVMAEARYNLDAHEAAKAAGPAAALLGTEIAAKRADIATVAATVETLRQQVSVYLDTQSAVTAALQGRAQAQQRREKIQAQLAHHADLVTAKAKLADLDAQGAAAATRESAAVTEARAAGERELALRAERDELLKHRATQATEVRAVEAAEAAECEARTTKACERTVASAREHLLDLAIRPLLTAANGMLKDVADMELSWRDGELLLGGHAHEACSDSEKLLAYACVSLALACGHPGALRLCTIGRLESIDPERGLALLRKVQKLIAAGRLDQCLLVGVGCEWVRENCGDNIKIINL